MRPRNWRRGTLRGLQASFREGVCSSQPHAPPTPGATAGGGLALAGGCFPVRHGPVPVGQGHSPCPHPRPPGAESLSPVSHLHRLPPFMLSLPWTRPTAPCRGPARAEASREQRGRPGTGRDGTDGELRGSDVYRRTRAAGAAEGMGDISDQEAERLPRGWGCRVPTVRNEPSTDVGQTRPWSLARGRVLPKPPPHAPRTTPEAPRPPYRLISHCCGHEPAEPSGTKPHVRLTFWKAKRSTEATLAGLQSKAALGALSSAFPSS